MLQAGLGFQATDDLIIRASLGLRSRLSHIKAGHWAGGGRHASHQEVGGKAAAARSPSHSCLGRSSLRQGEGVTAWGSNPLAKPCHLSAPVCNSVDSDQRHLSPQAGRQDQMSRQHEVPGTYRALNTPSLPPRSQRTFTPTASEAHAAPSCVLC